MVRKNLKLCFPSKTDRQRLQLEKDFYKHFCDLYLEMIKSLSMNAATMKKRFKYINPELITEVEKKGKSVIYLAGHFANFEWMTSFQLNPTKHKGFGVYKRVRNPYFDKLVKDIRGKFFVELIDKNDIAGLMQKHYKTKEKANYGIIADQAPRHTKKAYWGRFMNLDSPMFVGAEVFAKKHDLALVFIHVRKIKRGYYEAELKEITTEPKSFKNFEITDQYFRLLEEEIRENPPLYFWTHKRWKHL